MDEILNKLERGEFDRPNQKANLILKVRQYINKLEQENEKLKKVIEIYKKISFIDKESTTSYLVRNGIITQQEYELLKEVLGK